MTIDSVAASKKHETSTSSALLYLKAMNRELFAQQCSKQNQGHHHMKCCLIKSRCTSLYDEWPKKQQIWCIVRHARPLLVLDMARTGPTAACIIRKLTGRNVGTSCLPQNTKKLQTVSADQTSDAKMPHHAPLAPTPGRSRTGKFQGLTNTDGIEIKIVDWN